MLVADATKGLNGPFGLAIDNDDNIFVANNPPSAPAFILKFDPSGTPSPFAADISFQPSIRSMTFDQHGYLYASLAEDNKILKFDKAGNFSVFAEASNGLNFPYSITVGTCLVGKIIMEIDVKLRSDTNPINPRSKGKISVAILTTNTFDATTVNAATVHFGATGTEAAPIVVAVKDTNGDGLTDMLLLFTDRCILSLIFPWVNIRTWTDEMAFPKPGERPAASGRLTSRNMGGNKVKLPKRLVCPQRRSASGWRRCVNTA
jgi:hypothetical protein